MPTKPPIRLLVVTPDEVVLDQPVVSVRFQQADGWRGILAHHAPYITQILSSVLMYRLPEDPDTRHYLALYGGTLEVQEDKILVLTAVAEPGDDLKELSASIERRQAEADAIALEAHIEFTQVRMALMRALTGLPPPPEAIR